MVVGYNIKDTIKQKESEISNELILVTSINGPMDSPWSTIYHDNNHTGRSPYSTINSNVEKWRYYDERWKDSSPAIDNNGIIYISDTWGCFSAIYPNGTLKWKYTLDGQVIGSAPSISEDGTIYIGAWDNKIYAINPNGTLKWKISTGGRVTSSTIIDNDGTIYAGNANGRIFAVYSNGTKKWHYDTGDYIASDPAIGYDGTIYIGSLDNYLYAFYSNGTLRWRFKTGDRIYGSPSISEDGTIYIGSSWDSYLYALYPDGTEKWKYKNAGTPNNPSIAIDGTIYAGYQDKLVALNPDGTLKWKFDIGNNRYIGKSAPAISGEGIIYFGIHLGQPGSSTGGEIIAVNPDGTENWRKKIANKWIDSSPVIGEDGSIYIGSAYSMGIGYLHAFGTQESNEAPEAPGIDGPTEGKINKNYDFEFVSTDPDRNPISFYVNWGDGTSHGWTMDVNTGEFVTLSHKWTSVDDFTITARTRDTFGLESDETEFEIKISNPRTRTPWMKFLEMFPITMRLLELWR